MEKKKNIKNEDESLQAYLKEIRRYKILSHEEEIAYARRIEQGDKKALEALINANLRLVVVIAKFYVTVEMGLTDLIQEGNFGLMRAAEKYDYRKNVRFGTYSTFWIKQFISKAFYEKRHSIRIPQQWEKKLKRLNEANHEFLQENNRTPNTQELLESSGMGMREMLKTMNIQNITVSLDSDLESNQGTFMDFIQDETYTPESMFLQKSIKEAAINCLNMLQENEKTILMCRFAIEGGKKQTLRTIALKMGISSETVRQIELRALNKLKTRAQSMRHML